VRDGLTLSFDLFTKVSHVKSGHWFYRLFIFHHHHVTNLSRCTWINWRLCKRRWRESRRSRWMPHNLL